MNDSAESTAATWPEPNSLAEVQYIDAPHPSVLALDVFTNQCRLTSHRRGGPGGQHRNKVSSAVLALHESTSISAEANERRDQVQNRRVAIERLRLRLALVLRTAASIDATAEALDLRQRWHGRPLKISESNADRAAVMALVLDDLHRAGGQPSLVADLWSISTTSLVQFVATQPAAWLLVNQWRAHHGRSALRS